MLNTSCRRAQWIITAVNDPFSVVETYHAESRFYKANGKGKVDDVDIPTTITVRHPLTGFTHPITPLKCGTIDTYHRFEVPKKGGVEKSIIFHALEDMDRHGKYRGKSRPCTSCNMSESQRSAEAIMIREGMEKDFHHSKACSTQSKGRLCTQKPKYPKTEKG